MILLFEVLCLLILDLCFEKLLQNFYKAIKYEKNVLFV